MIYSYTQISQYLTCPARYKYRYLDGWQEKDSRANLLFGRAFEIALAAYFRGQDSEVALFEAWQPYQQASLEYSKGDSWEGMLGQGITLLQRFAQEDRVQIADPKLDLQIKFSREMSGGNEFVAYIDAIGKLAGRRVVIDWKTTSARYPDQPEGLLALDPQLACYSWITDEPNVAFVVFVRKRLPEIQYLTASISQAQRDQFECGLMETIRQIESAHFPAHGGIRFPQNRCTSCPYLGLCLGREPLVELQLTRRPGGDLAWLDQLDC